MLVEVGLGHQDDANSIVLSPRLIDMSGQLIWVGPTAKFEMLLQPFKKTIEEEKQRN